MSKYTSQLPSDSCLETGSRHVRDHQPAPTAAHGPRRTGRPPLAESPGHPRGLLDGAWWPRSRDLLRELPDLTDVLDPHWGRITRIAVNPAHWPVIPRKVPVHGHVVKVGWFTPELDPHKVLLLSYSVGRWDLLVIPPETRPAAAARLMAAASDPTGAPLTASALMAVEEARHGDSSAGRVQNPEEAWEYEGGASSTHAAAVALAGRPKAGV